MMQDSQKKAEGLSPKVLFEASENRERERGRERERQRDIGYSSPALAKERRININE